MSGTLRGTTDTGGPDPLVQALSHLVGAQLGASALVAGDDDPGGRDPGESGQSQPLPQAHAMIVP